MTFEISNNLPEDKKIKVGDQEIAVKQYVPIEDKLKAIETILSFCLNADTGLYLPGHVLVYRELYTFYLYTDIEFSEADKDTPMPLYDALINSDFYRAVKEALPTNDYLEFTILLDDFISQFETYQTSAYGILDSMSKDYKNLNFDIEELQKKLTNRENIQLVDEIVTKLG